MMLTMDNHFFKIKLFNCYRETGCALLNEPTPIGLTI